MQNHICVDPWLNTFSLFMLFFNYRRQSTEHPNLIILCFKMLPYEEMFLKICKDCFFVLNELQQYIWNPWSGSPIQKWSYDYLFLCQHNCTDARFGVPKSLMLMLKTQAFWVFMLSGRLLIPCVSKEHMAFILKDQGLLLEFLDPYIWRCYIPL